MLRRRAACSCRLRSGRRSSELHVDALPCAATVLWLLRSAAVLAAAIMCAVTSATAAAEIAGTKNWVSGKCVPFAAQCSAQATSTTCVRHFGALCTASASLVDGLLAVACCRLVTRCVHCRLSSGVYLSTRQRRWTIHLPAKCTQTIDQACHFAACCAHTCRPQM